MNGKAKTYPYPKHAESLIAAYVSDTEHRDFGEAYSLACERDERAAEALYNSYQEATA
jgi:hypothetical protein